MIHIKMFFPFFVLACTFLPFMMFKMRTIKAAVYLFLYVYFIAQASWTLFIFALSKGL